jgi:hypothetical protein
VGLPDGRRFVATSKERAARPKCPSALRAAVRHAAALTSSGFRRSSARPSRSLQCRGARSGGSRSHPGGCGAGLRRRRTAGATRVAGPRRSGAGSRPGARRAGAALRRAALNRRWALPASEDHREGRRNGSPSAARLERSEGLVSCNVELGCRWQRLNPRRRRDTCSRPRSQLRKKGDLIR